ncbi:MAG: DUF4157 domain-containing protein [Chitinophagaceae bacterium]|nr:DUF4157 domain-containing protein [Chitinophagaceae bacterium]
MISVTIKENSWMARIAARKLKVQKVAMVLGNTIHLHNTSKSEFLLNKKWLRHEIAHVKQYKQFGFLQFVFMYLMESFNNGYDNNRFEVEARVKERDLTVLEGIEIN